MNWRKPVIAVALFVKGDKTLAKLGFIRALNQKTDEEKLAYQRERLEKLLLHASQHVPYYRDVLAEAGVVVNGAVHLENFGKIPVLTKEIIRREKGRLYSDDRQGRKPYKNTSGGSTGEPVEFLQDKEYSEWNIANKIFYKTFANQEIGERELRLWGSERDILLGKEKSSIRFRNFLYNRRELNAFRMSEKDMASFVGVWNKFRPRWAEAYVQSIYEFAKFTKHNCLKVHSPKGILTSAGTLYKEMEETISSVFGCPVFNRYGSREVGDMACSDGSDGDLRLSIWNQYLEVLDDRRLQTGVDDLGKIHVTTLNNYSMPFIRYDIGDVGVRGNDPLYIKKVEGREMNMLRAADGKLVPAEFFIHFVGVVYNKGFISKFQVVQREADAIKIKVVLRDLDGFRKSKGDIEATIRKVMGQIGIDWEDVADIPPLKSGKYQYVVRQIEGL